MVYRPEKNEVNVFTLTILLLGLFPGVFGIVWFGSRTFVTIDTLFHILLLTGGVALLLHLPFRRLLNRYWGELIAYCWIGWGGILLALALMLNYLAHGNERVTVYGMSDNKAVMVLNALEPVEIEVNDPELKLYSHMRSFEQSEIMADTLATQAVYHTAMGALGYKILLKKALR